MRALSRDFYLRDAETAARELLGKLLVHRQGGAETALIITETEAYLGAGDPACHSFGGKRTPRTEVLYGPGGHAYVYLIYGIHNLLNAVTGEEGDPCAVLIRAGLPFKGHDKISENRLGKPWGSLNASGRRTLCDGPGKLSAALGITRAQNGLDLTASGLMICEGERRDTPSATIAAGPRIGVDYAGEAALWPLNFKLILCNF